MKNKNDKRGKSPANFYDRIAEMLGKAAIPQTITVEAEGVSPETFSAAGITKRELYATVAMASLAHAIITTHPSEAAGFVQTGRGAWLHRPQSWPTTSTKRSARSNETANPQKIQDDENSVFATQKGVVRNDRAGR